MTSAEYVIEQVTLEHQKSNELIRGYPWIMDLLKMGILVA